MVGMEPRLCFVTPLLSWPWTLLRFCVSESFAGKFLDLDTNLLLLEKWPNFPSIQKSVVRRQIWTLWERSDIKKTFNSSLKFYFGLSSTRLLELFWILTCFIFARHLYCVKGQHCAPTSDHRSFSRPPNVFCVLFLKSIWFYPVNWILIQQFLKQIKNQT